jgi:predicted regulator of Ras-like GTPase activity (Roadblock/LC7/MglB family)
LPPALGGDRIVRKASGPATLQSTNRARRSGREAIEALELLGVVSLDILGRQHSVALSALFRGLGNADGETADEGQFREVIMVSDEAAYVFQRFHANAALALVSVHPADCRLGFLLSDARRHLEGIEAAFREEVA